MRSGRRCSQHLRLYGGVASATPSAPPVRSWAQATLALDGRASRRDATRLYLAHTVEMSAFCAPVMWRWFNPETGQLQAGQGDAENRGQKTFERPAGWGDALLVPRGPKAKGAVPGKAQVRLMAIRGVHQR
jgi:hypothetical protein